LPARDWLTLALQPAPEAHVRNTEMNEEPDILLRYVKLRSELRPVEICISDPPEPIDPFWVGITRCRYTPERRTVPVEAYVLSFMAETGEEITWEQFDTLRIAIDQGYSIAGILPDEWQALRLEWPDGGLPFAKVVEEHKHFRTSRSS